MTLVYPIDGTYPPAGVDPAKPQTHALIIGVSEYPWLRGGQRFKELEGQETLGLHQLTSPVLSATAFGNWLLNPANKLDRPLGSLEMLLSPAPFKRSDGQDVAVDPATMDNVQAAFDSWFLRCRASPDNLAILYFCGHGIKDRGEYDLVIASDFGESEVHPYSSCIDIRGTWTEMAACKAKSQIYFIDACRETPIGSLMAHVKTPRTLTDASSIGDLKNRKNGAIFWAAAPGNKAYAPENGVSFFTQALIECLDKYGAGAVRIANSWQVTTHSLITAMQARMKRTVLPDKKRGECDATSEGSANGVIRDLSGNPEVMVNICCDPRDANQAATFGVTGDHVPEDLRERKPEAEMWEIVLAPGDYEISATFPLNSSLNATKFTQTILPPVVECEFPVTSAVQVPQ